MDMYKTLRAVVLAAAPVLYGTGCEKNNGDPVVPSPLETTVVHASAKVDVSQGKLNLDTPKVALQTFYDFAQNKEYSFLPDVFLKNLEGMYENSTDVIRRTISAKRKEDTEFFQRI